MSTKIWYTVVEEGDPHNRYNVNVPGKADFYCADAERAAREYHGMRGWEMTWPLTFVLYATEDGPEAARFSVDLECVPSFYATEAEAPVKQEAKP